MTNSDHDLLRLLRARPNTPIIVARLYLIALDRAPDPSGLMDFSNRLNSGESVALISKAIIDSEEFQALHANRMVAAALYQKAAGRQLTADDSDLAALVLSLVEQGSLPARDDEQPVTRPPLEAQAGDEGSGLIRRLYQIAYGRRPDDAGLDHFSTLLNAGEPLVRIVGSVLASPEFRDRNGQAPTPVHIYQNAVTTPEEPGRSLEAFLAGLVQWIGLYDQVSPVAALFPNGLAMTEPGAHDLWSRTRAAQQHRARKPSPVPQMVTGITWIVTLVEPDLTWLRRLVASVVRQAGKWQLIIAWSGRLPRQVQQYLVTVRAGNASIIIVRGGGQSRAALFGAALYQATMPCTCLIGQHDDLVADANSSLCLSMGNADVLIADEDEIDSGGMWASPHMGTAWDPDYTAVTDRRGLVVYRTQLLRAVGGMRAASAVLGEWDMLLRASANIRESQISHLPRIMCHRRGRDYATAPLDTRAAVLSTALAKLGEPSCRPALSREGALRLQHALPAIPPMASIIIPTRDRADYLQACVHSILTLTSYRPFEILILDNDSRQDQTRDLLTRLSSVPAIRVIPSAGAFNWSQLNNVAVLEMRGEVAVFLNNDTEIHDRDWLTELVSQASRPGIGAVGAKLLYPNGTIQHAGIALGPGGKSTHVWRHAPNGDPGYLDQLRGVRRVAAVTGACLATRRSVFEAAGGFEHHHLKVTWSDVDYCLRVRALGLHVLWSPHATLTHHEQATRGPDTTPEAAARLSAEEDYMRNRWGNLLDADPYWSENLWPDGKEPRFSFLPLRGAAPE